ncbi:hypothetical protein AB0M79_02540 [Polymorphospora sp. NPDC051019]|uniref:aromatic-ring hydroxylase C-terminal domain-containing protein n=1 Tax=Polymorphospora sp. NPDC051019 TaxID=3155725 RepID=UPI0034230224
MFSDLRDRFAHRYVAYLLAGMDVRNDLGDDHRLVGILCPDRKLTLERPDPDVVTEVTRSADLLREGRGLLFDLVDPRGGPRRRGRVDRTGQTPSPPVRTGWTSTALLIRPDGCVAWALSAGQDLDVTKPVGALGIRFGHPA